MTAVAPAREREAARGQKTSLSSASKRFFAGIGSAYYRGRYNALRPAPVFAPVAQWIEQPPPKGQVGRSIRLRGARAAAARPTNWPAVIRRIASITSHVH